MRFHLKEGKELAGYFGDNSFAASSPNAQQPYVEEVWRLDADGKFIERVEETEGAMVNREDCVLIEFLRPRKHATGERWMEAEPSLAQKKPILPANLGGVDLA